MKNNGLQYFPHSCAVESESLQYLFSKFKVLGHSVYYRLLERIYRNNGYFMQTNDRYLSKFSDDVFSTLEDVRKIIDFCVNEDIFNKALYDEYEILTSVEIQENFNRVAKRRTGCEIEAAYNLLKPDDKNTKVVNNNEFNVNANSHTKVKYTKENENVFLYGIKRLAIATEKKKFFAEELLKYREKFGDDKIDAFFGYWTEENDAGLLRVEEENFFDILIRLQRFKIDKKNSGSDYKSALPKKQKNYNNDPVLGHLDYEAAKKEMTNKS